MTTPAQEIESYKTTRHRCQHCRRSFATKAYAENHVAFCQKRMSNHGCKTCALFEEAEPPSMDRVYPGSSRGCGAGVDLSDGLLSIHCPHWEAIF
jgi:hypothetical protein